MSYYGNLLGMFTEDEISGGVPEIVLGRWDWRDDHFYDDPKDDPKEHFKLENDRGYYFILSLVRDFNRYHDDKTIIKLSTIEVDDEKQYAALKAIKKIEQTFDLIDQAETENNTKIELTKEIIYKALRKKIIMDESGQIVMRYLKKENLSTEYFAIVQKPNALKLILQDGLTRVLKKDGLDQSTLLELDELCQRIYVNEYLEIPYVRVSDIQKFIHQKYNETYGIKAHKKIIKEEIRMLLSVCRLHLGLHDYLFKDYYYAKQLEDSCMQAAKNEFDKLKDLYSHGECQTTDFLKVVYLKPIRYYMSIRQRLVLELLDFLFKFKSQVSEEQFKELSVCIAALKHRENPIAHNFKFNF